MGINLCSISNINEYPINNNDNKIIIIPSYDQNDVYTNNIIKIQKYIRGYLSHNKLISLFESTKSEIIKELDLKKLVNETNITECESHLHYLKFKSNENFIPFSEYLNKNPEFTKTYSNLTKYAFSIPYFIVSSPNEVYKGSWNINKKYHGLGVKYEFDEKKTKNKRIEGLFLNGLLFGQGLVIFSNGEILTGIFQRNILNGNGEHYRKDESIYKGEFKNGKYNGIGNEIYKDGSVFEGFFTDGEKKYGSYEFKNGSKYQGEFKNNLFEGKGKYSWTIKKFYDGNWKNGKMNGKGKFSYQDGTYYEGEFLDGKKNGQGKYVWGKDRYFEGRWKNNKQNGYGVYYDKNKIIKGVWFDGKILNKNCNIIKKNNTFSREIKNRNETPVKKEITQKNFYNRNNLTEKKVSDNKINFDPTVNGKYSIRNYKNYFNINKFNQNSLYSIESTNTIKSNNNQGDVKTLNEE